MKLEGKKYERRLARHLRGIWGPNLVYGPWIEFIDAGGRGWAQPDFLVHVKGAVLVLESKLSECLDAELQLRGLYGPLVSELYPQSRLVLCQVFRNLRAGSSTALLRSPKDLEGLPPWSLSTWHWVG